MPLDCVSWCCVAEKPARELCKLACSCVYYYTYRAPPAIRRPTPVFGRTLTRIARPENLASIYSRFGRWESLLVVRAKLTQTHADCRETASYYDPEGETIYLSSPAATDAPKKGRRGPELNETSLVTSVSRPAPRSSARLRAKINFTALRGFDGSPRHAVSTPWHVSLRREPDFAQAPRRRRLHEPLWVCVRAFRCGNFTPARQPSRHRRNVCSMHRWASMLLQAYAPMFLGICWFGIAFAALVKHAI